jgi:hypothetical protein
LVFSTGAPKHGDTATSPLHCRYNCN